MLDEKKSLVFTIAFRLLMQVRKAQSSQSGLNPSGSKNAKGMTCALVYLVVYLTYKCSNKVVQSIINSGLNYIFYL